MATQYKTQCPHCQAQFRISEQHLKQAKGQVRCGSCLKVFLATEHLVNEAPPAAAKPAPAAKPKQPAAARPAAPARPKPAAAPAPTPPASNSPEGWSLPASEPEKPEQPASRWTLGESADTSTEEEGLEDFSDDGEIPEARPQPNDTKVSLGSIELSDSFMSLDGDEDDEHLHQESFSDMAGAGRASQGEDSDESWAEKLLEELSDDGKPAPPQEVSADTLELEQTSSRSTKKRKAKAAKPAAPAAEAEPDWAQDTDNFFADDGFGLTDESADEEVVAIELPKAEKKSVAPRIQLDSLVASSADLLRWAALSALMALIFCVQYLSFNFSDLARTPQWRGFYATVCGAVGCSLPNPSDIALVHGSNLVVRKHPQYSNALMVDVLLTNQADYAQPFPVIELGFTTIDGAAVASRRFTPDEYLHGDMAGATTMPIDTPVHVSLEILDPGDNARNYTLRFFPAPEKGA